VNLKLKLGCLSFQNKIKNFQGDILPEKFSHFPNVRMVRNGFYEEATADHKVEEYKNTLQDYHRSSKPDLTIYRNKKHDLHPCKPIQH